MRETFGRGPLGFRLIAPNQPAAYYKLLQQRRRVGKTGSADKRG